MMMKLIFVNFCQISFRDTSEVKTDNGNDVKITLSPQPSHLEAVDPVVEGITRSKLDHELNGDEKKILPILIMVMLL